MKKLNTRISRKAKAQKRLKGWVATRYSANGISPVTGLPVRKYVKHSDKAEKRTKQTKQAEPKFQTIHCDNCGDLISATQKIVKGAQGVYDSIECLEQKEGSRAVARFIEPAVKPVSQNLETSKLQGRPKRGEPLALEGRLKTFWGIKGEYTEGQNEISIKTDSDNKPFLSYALRGREIARQYANGELYISLGGWNTSMVRSRLKNVIGVEIVGDRIPAVKLANGNEVQIGTGGWYNITRNAVLKVTQETQANNNFVSGSLSATL